MPPSNCFRTGRRSLTQSPVKAVHTKDSKWMSASVYHRNRRREAGTRAEGPEKPVSCAPPERVRRSLALLTRTHHGGRQLFPNPIPEEYPVIRPELSVRIHGTAI